MEVRTQFIDNTDGAWIKGVPCLIPNLQEGQFVITMDGKEKDYRKWRWRIDKIETIIGSNVDTVLQEVYMTCCGPEDQWQEIIGEKK